MNEFTLGTCVGMIQTIVGHPLDTIKTNYQNNKCIKLNKYIKLYRGLTYPLFSTTIINGLLFYSNDTFNSISNNNYISGFLTGIVCSPLINVFETYKVKEQLCRNLSNNIIKYSKLGLSATLARESFGASLYFGTYNSLRDNYNPFISGSSAGLFSWLLTYPFDVIKTRLQSGLDKNWYQAIKRGGLTNGLSVCLIRSFIVNGFSFMAYDYIKHQNKFD